MKYSNNIIITYTESTVAKLNALVYNYANLQQPVSMLLSTGQPWLSREAMQLSSVEDVHVIMFAVASDQERMHVV